MTSTKIMVNKVAVSKEEYKAFHVNRVKDEFSNLRSKSKISTFALQYSGTPNTLVKNSGFTKTEADQIYQNYHNAYIDSVRYTSAKKSQASKDGYISVAFGLRVRTPLIAQTFLGKSNTPKEAEAEARTAGNAVSQSFGLLNNRATNAFMEKVWKSKFRYSILPIGQIHDCTYFLIKNDLETLEWANKHLIEEMEWQDLPEIQHPDVHLGAELDVCIEGWHKPITVPNGANQDEIRGLILI